MAMSFRTCEVSTYEKSCTSANAFLFDREALIKDLQGWSSVKDYAFIYHDKDPGKDKHIHLMIRFKNPVPLEKIAKHFGLQTSQIEKVKGKFGDALAYLTHKNAPDKFQYSQEEVSSNFDFVQEIKAKDEVLARIYAYGNCDISRKELMASLSPQEYNQNKRTIDNMTAYRQERMEDRNMQVYYISGGSGCGKTTLAKYLAKSLGYDYFVTGSGKDILDGYDREECIIVDDLRGDVFTKAEFFKFLDNNTNSSVKSRYKNKDISRCRLMIITSIKDPIDLYDWGDGWTFDKDCETACLGVKATGGDKDEPVKQFVRRLKGQFLRITEKGDIEGCYLNDACGVVGREICEFDMKFVYDKMNIKIETGKRSIFESSVFAPSIKACHDERIKILDEAEAQANKND